jgi:hypothetical protein
VVYPFTNLSNGSHSIRFKAWDVYNNSSEATLDFVVASADGVELQDLMNFPNPFTDYTTFSFEYNQSAGPVEAEINIYSMQGKLLATLNADLPQGSYRSRNLTWPGTTNGGQKLGGGTYLFTVTLKNGDGSSAYKSSKLVIVR